MVRNSAVARFCAEHTPTRVPAPCLQTCPRNRACAPIRGHLLVFLCSVCVPAFIQPAFHRVGQTDGTAKIRVFEPGIGEAPVLDGARLQVSSQGGEKPCGPGRLGATEAFVQRLNICYIRVRNNKKKPFKRGQANPCPTPCGAQRPGRAVACLRLSLHIGP